MKHTHLLLGLLALAACGVVEGNPQSPGSGVALVDGVTPTSVVAGRALVGLAGKCLDINGAWAADGTRVQLWDCNGSPAQSWITENGALTALAGYCLDIPGNAQYAGAPLQIWRCNGSDAQKWRFDEGRIVSTSGYCVDIYGAFSSNGTQAQLWTCNGQPNQHWVWNGEDTAPATAPVDGDALVGLADKCLDAMGSATNDTPVGLWSCAGDASQAWSYDGAALAVYGNYCLDVPGNAQYAGAPLQIYLCNGSDAQRWHFDGTALKSTSGLCVDIGGRDSTDGTRALLWPCNGQDNQSWRWANGTTPTTPQPTQDPGSGVASGFVPDGYTLVFGDEFDGDRLDTAKWWTRYVYANGTLDRLNDEQQRYRENGNHVVSGGTLKLTARKVSSDDPWGIDYESGMIRSKTIVKYGYLEARVRMPRGLGVWPAFWLNAEESPWPPEIDIFEFVNNGVEDRIDMLHTGVIDHGAQGSAFLYSDPAFNTQWTFWTAPYAFPDDFHVVALLWDESSATTFVDGVPIVKRGYHWVHDDGSDAGFAHVLLNLAIGGQWAGRHGVDDSAFPQALEVDYVRVYQGQRNVGTSTTGQDLCPGDGGC